MEDYKLQCLQHLFPDDNVSCRTFRTVERFLIPRPVLIRGGQDTGRRHQDSQQIIFFHIHTFPYKSGSCGITVFHAASEKFFELYCRDMHIHKKRICGIGMAGRNIEVIRG